MIIRYWPLCTSIHCVASAISDHLYSYALLLIVKYLMILWKIIKIILFLYFQKKNWLDDGKSVLLNHPIYRVFYVSHDSQDLKIFSYIARDGASNVFKCAVFKSSKKVSSVPVFLKKFNEFYSQFKKSSNFLNHSCVS